MQRVATCVEIDILHLNPTVFPTPSRSASRRPSRSGRHRRRGVLPEGGSSSHEVTKYLVYNMRKRQEGGDKAKEYERGVIF